MGRSRWKLCYFSNAVWRKIMLFKLKNFYKFDKLFYERSSSIPECFQFRLIKIHKGKFCRNLRIHIFNVGYKFGEFAFTRKPFYFPLKKSLKRKKYFFKK